MPYTFVLTPKTNNVNYVEMSQRLFDGCNKDYRLNQEGTSSPHISLIQFDCESLEKANQVWQKMKNQLEALDFHPFVPPFTGMAFVNGTGEYEGTVWAELSVSRGDVDSPIMRVHSQAVEVVESFGLTIRNACGNNFRPHLTLARIIMPEQIKTWNPADYSNPGEFTVEFGKSDEYWQYAEKIDVYSKP